MMRLVMWLLVLVLAVSVQLALPSFSWAFIVLPFLLSTEH
jgi:hypothetical protein